MSNVDKRRGFKPVEYLNGAAWNGQSRKYHKVAGTTVTNDMFVGDMVTLSGTGDADGIPGVSVATAGQGNVSIGVIVGVAPDPDRLERNNWIDGAEAGYVLVADDPNLIFEAQADGVIAATDLGDNANMVQTAAGSRTSGASGQEVGTIDSTATAQLKVIGFPQRPDNTINAANNKVLVLINNHVYKSGTGTAGI